MQAARFDLAGSGNTTIAGTTEKLGLNIAGSGNIAASGLKARSADVTIAGSGDVDVEVNGPAKINLLGSGNIDLGKGATCSTSKLGSGKVTCGH